MNDRSSTYVEALERVIAHRNPQLIMCIVTNNRSDRYSAIKKKCCVDRPGIFTLLNMSSSYFAASFSQISLTFGKFTIV
jgi:hypothetical protein